jgi:hypothetical protein
MIFGPCCLIAGVGGDEGGRGGRPNQGGGSDDLSGVDRYRADSCDWRRAVGAHRHPRGAAQQPAAAVVNSGGGFGVGDSKTAAGLVLPVVAGASAAGGSGVVCGDH